MNRLLSQLILGLMLTNAIFMPVEAISAYNPIVADLLAESQQTRWLNWIAALSGEKTIKTSTGEGKILTRSSFVMFEPKHTPSAFDYLQTELQNLGFKEAQDFEIHTYNFPYEDRHPERNWKNLILTFPGNDPDLEDELILLVAHLDSTSDQEHTLAPGADDNASGAAGLMEAAAVLRHHQFERTIHLVWFSGEEQSRQGSEHFVVDYAKWLPKIVGVVNLDMFAFDWDDDRCFEVHAGTLPGSRRIGQSMRSIIETYNLNLTFDFIDDETAYTFSDHYPFWQQGIPGVMIFENGFYQEGKTCGKADRNYRYHTTADTITYINQETGFSILQASIATVAHMAGPTSTCFSTAPRIHGYTDLQSGYLQWETLPQAAVYQVWIGTSEGWKLAGETNSNRWVFPHGRIGRLKLFQVVAVTNTGCQSQPATYPNQ